MKPKGMFMFLIIVVMSAHVFAEQTTPTVILERAITEYNSLKTYQSEGTVVSQIDTYGSTTNFETAFSMKLKKPNLYLISWTQKNMPMPGMTQSGMVWNAGTQPYLYMGIMNSYSKMENDEMAIASATGISSGAAFTIPSLFLLLFKAQPGIFSRLIDPKLEKLEKIEGEECYVISATSSISKKESFWISTKTHLIKKYYRSFERPEGGVSTPEMSDEEMEQALKTMGKETTEESKAELKEMMRLPKEMRGFLMEIHSKISFPELTANDFQPKLPPGVKLTESLLKSEGEQISKMAVETANNYLAEQPAAPGVEMKSGQEALKAFRKDIPIIKPSLVLSGKPKEENRNILIYISHDPVATIDKLYQNELGKNGWKIKSRSISKQSGEEITEFSCEKKGAKLTISLLELGTQVLGRTAVTLEISE